MKQGRFVDALLSSTNDVLRVAAARTTVRVAGKRGSRSGQVACIGYPKSGTSWVAKMLATVLEIPEPSFYRTPVIRPAVLHGHEFVGGSVPTVCVVRDPRDVMISLYHHRARKLQSDPSPRYRAAMQKRYTNLAPLTADNFEQNIHQFVEIELVSPRDSRHSWLEHTAWADAQSLSGREHFAEVRYEDLRTNPEIHLAEVLAQIGHDRSLTEVNSAVASNSFDSLSGGRSPGQVDDSSFFRSGIQGEWKRKMSSETAEMIQAVFEPQMMRLGYLVEDSS